MGSFGDYLAGLGDFNAQAPPPATAGANPYGTGEFIPHAFNPGDPGYGVGYGGGGGFLPNPNSIESQLTAGFNKAAGIVTKASQGTGDLLTNSYRSALRERLAGNAGALGQQEEAFGAQRYAPDVGARLAYAPRAANLQATGQAIGENQSALGVDQAQLLKGTGTELAGLTTEQLSDLINLKIAKDSASATKKAGLLGALGQVGGSLGAAAILA
jgi:hypothetical protein